MVCGESRGVFFTQQVYICRCESSTRSPRFRFLQCNTGDNASQPCTVSRFKCSAAAFQRGTRSSGSSKCVINICRRVFSTAFPSKVSPQRQANAMGAAKTAFSCSLCPNGVDKRPRLGHICAVSKLTRILSLTFSYSCVIIGSEFCAMIAVAARPESNQRTDRRQRLYELLINLRITISNREFSIRNAPKSCIIIESAVSNREKRGNFSHSSPAS